LGVLNGERACGVRYLALTFSTGQYVPYESLVAQAAAMEGLDLAFAQRLTQAHGQLRPWPADTGTTPHPAPREQKGDHAGVEVQPDENRAKQRSPWSNRPQHLGEVPDAHDPVRAYLGRTPV
jgi:hypothetical protein